MVYRPLKRSGMDHTVLPATITMPALPRKRSPDKYNYCLYKVIKLQITTQVIKLVI